jgi:rhamnogalacturonyl hydrolase YesR
VSAEPRAWSERVLDVVNVALWPLGVAMWTFAQRASILDELRVARADARWARQARGWVLEELAAAMSALRVAEKERDRAVTSLRQLDELVAQGQSVEARAARRVLDVALGRDVEPAA